MAHYVINPELTEAALAMVYNGMDYWPYDLASYPGKSLYDFGSSEEDLEGVWLVDTNNSCSMKDAIKLIKVL